MATNDLIRVPDYNDIFNLINPVLGTGSSTFGYGQTTLASTVNTNSRVSKTQWDNLRYDIINAIAHQTGSPPSIVEANEGDLVQYDANLPNFQYLTLASQASTNRFNIAAGRYAVEQVADVDSFVTFYGTVSVILVASWANSNLARAFFNSGGRIQVGSTFTPFKSSQQNDDWQSLLSTAGTVYFDGNTGVNFYSLTNADKTVDQQTGSAYSQNVWRISARSNVANNATGTATQVIITSSWIDGYADTSTNNNQAPREGVSGRLTLTVTQRRAYAALYPNLVAGSFQGPRPTWSWSDFAVSDPGERQVGPGTTPDPGTANAFIYPSKITSYILNSNLPKTSTGSFIVEHENKASTNGSYTLTLKTSPSGSVVVTNPALNSTITLGPNQSQTVNYTVTSPLGSYPDSEFIYEFEIVDANGNTYNPIHRHTQIRVLTESEIPAGSSLPSFGVIENTPGTTPEIPIIVPSESDPIFDPIYDESIFFSPSTVARNVLFSGSITGGVPNTAFTLTWRNSSGVELLSGSGTLDSSGNYSSGAIGSFPTAGTYTATVVFSGSGNTRSRSIVIT